MQRIFFAIIIIVIFVASLAAGKSTSGSASRVGINSDGSGKRNISTVEDPGGGGAETLKTIEDEDDIPPKKGTKKPSRTIKKEFRIQNPMHPFSRSSKINMIRPKPMHR